MKKLLALLLVVVLLTTCIPAFASQPLTSYEKAVELKKLGMFAGTDKGFELDQEPTRVQGGIMLIRMLGGAKEALSAHYTHPFKDVPEWADDYVGYLYKKGLTSGVSLTRYGSDDNITAQQYLTFCLKALGYKLNEDFKYENAIAKAREVKLITDSDIQHFKTTTFLRQDIVDITYKLLTKTYKGTSDYMFDRIKYNMDYPDGITGNMSGFKEWNSGSIMKLSAYDNGYYYYVNPIDHNVYRENEATGKKEKVSDDEVAMNIEVSNDNLFYIKTNLSSITQVVANGINRLDMSNDKVSPINEDLSYGSYFVMGDKIYNANYNGKFTATTLYGEKAGEKAELLDNVQRIFYFDGINVYYLEKDKKNVFIYNLFTKENKLYLDVKDIRSLAIHGDTVYYVDKDSKMNIYNTSTKKTLNPVDEDVYTLIQDSNYVYVASDSGIVRINKKNQNVDKIYTGLADRLSIAKDRLYFDSNPGRYTFGVSYIDLETGKYVQVK